MATAIRQLSSRVLVNQRAVQFIRAQTLTLSVIDARPNTVMNVFFGDTLVNHLCVGGAPGRTTNPNGQVTILLSIPGGQFNVGTYDVIVTDAPQLIDAAARGTIYGSAQAKFTAAGRVEIYQTSVTTIIGIERPIPPPPPQTNDWGGGWNGDSNMGTDPLAQSFFTYGVQGGMFLTSIDLFFATKDPALPVRIELRPMINGYPSSINTTNKNFISVVPASQVNVSTNASAATKFTFDPPIYLKENSDYCFIIRSNSSLYQVYTSRMGEVSIETGRRIFEQPYVGSVFKSENAITWTAEQFEDIKFRLNRAVFNTTPATVSFTASTPYLAAYGDQFATTNGSSVVTYTHPQNHGLLTGSKIYLYTDPGLTYNGIPSASFNQANGFTVTKVDDRTVSFTVANATSTNPITSGRSITYIAVTSGGTGYAVGDLVKRNTDNVGVVSAVDNTGAITSVSITNGLSELDLIPLLTVVSATGSGGAVAASIIPRFVVGVNKPLTGFIPQINILNFGTSSTTQTLSAPPLAGGSVVSIPFKEDEGIANLGQTLVIKSGLNNLTAPSAAVEVNLATSNPYVSPVIDVRTPPSLSVISPLINASTGGTVWSVSGSVTAPAYILWDGRRYLATTSGSLGSSPPTHTSGSASNGAVTLVYDGESTTPAGELNATNGTARARYVTQKVQLQMVSNGMRLFSTISSTSTSSVSWYVRTSLSSSSVNHDSLGWVELTCATPRNRSASIGEFYEYEFQGDSLPPFDTYDLKCVMTASDASKSPIISSYRVVVLT